MEGQPPAAAPANNRTIINTRGWPTHDKPSVTLQDQPATHPMALISPAATAITST